MQLKFPRFALFACALVLCVSCKKETSDALNFQHNKDGKGTPIATFNGDSITAEELKQRFMEMSPFLRSRYQTPEQKKDYVDGLARFELLAQEAHRRGLQTDPEVVETAKKVMVQKLIQKEFDEKPGALPDEQIKEYYEAHKTDYVKPELLRIADIFFAAPKGNAAERKKKKAKAEEVANKAKVLNPTDSPGFAALVRENSEDTRTKSIDGDSRFLSKEDLSSQFAPEVAAAAVEMKKAGDISPVIEAESGFYIIRFQGRQAALNLGLEQVKAQIQNRIQHEKRTQNFAKFVDELKAKGNYKLDEGALAKVEVDMKAPSAERKGPEPGFLPSPTSGPGPRPGGRAIPAPPPPGAKSPPPSSPPPMAKEPPRNP